MSDALIENDRKPAAVEEKEPRDLEKGEGGVKLPPSAKAQSRATQSSSSRHKRSHKHSQKHKHHHHNKTSRSSRSRGDIDEEKIADDGHLRASRHLTELVASADMTKQADNMKPPYKSSRVARRKEDVDDVSIAKPRESLMYAPSLAANTTGAATKAPEDKGKNGVLTQYSLPNIIQSHEYCLSLQGNSVSCRLRSNQPTTGNDDRACWSK